MIGTTAHPWLVLRTSSRHPCRVYIDKLIGDAMTVENCACERSPTPDGAINGDLRICQLPQNHALFRLGYMPVSLAFDMHPDDVQYAWMKL
jgi:hypothetical protein